MQETTKVRVEEMYEIYRKASAYAQAFGRLKDPAIRSGYISHLASTPDELVKLKAVYATMNPKDKAGLNALEDELNKKLKKYPELLPEKTNILEDLDQLYSKAFNLFIENLKRSAKTTEQRHEVKREPAPVVEPVQSWVQVEPATEKSKKQRFGWFSRRNKNKTAPKIEQVFTFEDMAKRKAAEQAKQQQLDADRKLAEYNRSVQQRGMANAAHERTMQNQNERQPNM